MTEENKQVFEDRKIQTAFKILQSKKNVFKLRASAKNVDMQAMFDEIVDGYFEKNPITEAEKQLIGMTE